MRLIGFTATLLTLFISLSFFTKGSWLTGILFLIACMLAGMAGSGLKSSLYLKSPLMPSIITTTVFLAISNGLMIWRKAWVQIFEIEIGGALYTLILALIGFLITTRRGVYAANPDMIPGTKQ